MANRMKRVYLEPVWKLRSNSQELITYPPQGYEFVTSDSLLERTAKTVSKTSLCNSFLLGMEKIMPVSLTKAYLEKYAKIPQDVDLTYSHDHLVFRKEPWVVDTEYVSLLVSYDPKHLKKYQGIVQKALAAEYCKKIICWYEAARRTFLINLDCTEFEHKFETVPLAVHKKEFTKSPNNDKVSVLFVGSGNIQGEFEIKGGREALEAFVLLSKKYDNLELVVRSDVPQDTKRKYQGYSNIRIIDEIIPWEMLVREFQSADIFLLPVHNTPWMVFLDAMSYELPIVTIDAWANSEIVEDGKTGLLVSTSERIPYYTENHTPTFGTPEFQKATKTPDPAVVRELAEKTAILIENRDLRRRMGKVGRWEVEHGRFSIERRNEKLKRIFDEATA